MPNFRYSISPNLYLDWVLSLKVYKISAKNVRSLKIDATLDRKLTLAFKNDMRNLGNLHQSMSASLKIRTLMGYIYPKQKIYELKIYRGVLCHGNEE